jgi:hypothetical protein
MNLLQKKLFKITSQPVTDYFAGSYSVEHIEESIDVITGTKDMPFEQMLDAQHLLLVPNHIPHQWHLLLLSSTVHQQVQWVSVTAITMKTCLNTCKAMSG